MGIRTRSSRDSLGFTDPPPALSYAQLVESPAAKALRLALVEHGLVIDSTVTPVFTPGQYSFLQTPASTTATTTGTDNLRVMPVLLPNITIDRVGLEVSAAGTAGCTLRIGIYRDNGHGKPGARVLDTGPVPGDAFGMVEAVLGTPLVLAAGIYYIGAVLQGAPATQPTLRCVAVPTFPPGYLNAIPLGIPGATVTAFGFLNSGVNGALPANFTVTNYSGVQVPRIFARFA